MHLPTSLFGWILRGFFAPIFLGADNVSFLDAVGATKTQATDDISSVHYPRVKLQRGADGSAADVDVAVGTALPVISGLATFRHLVCAASTNQTNIKAGAGYLRGFIASNALDTGAWVKFHNTAGAPTAGAGVVAAFFVQAGVTNFAFPAGINFSTGIAVTTISDSASTGGADSDTTALPTANRVVLGILYE